MLVAFASGIMTSCDQPTVYHHFENTPEAGWEKMDTLLFVVPALAEPGRYAQEVDLRINESYPFSSLSLLIEQHVFPGNRTKKHILHCRFAEGSDWLQHNGISFYKYSFALPDIDLRRGDSLRIFLRHDMKREILPGVSDVGLKLTRIN